MPDGPTLPRIVNLELTNRCNLACRFCDHPRLKASMRPQSMDTALLRTLLEAMADHRFEELGLVGLGEPLLDDRLGEHLDLIARYAAAFARITLNTNAVALNDRATDMVLASPVTGITFSINAAERKSYLEMMGSDAFDLVIRNIRRFMARRAASGNAMKISAQVMARPGEHGLQETLRAALGEGTSQEMHLFVRELYSKPSCAGQAGLNRPHAGATRRYPCWSLYSRVYVDVQGNLYPCTIGNDCYREGSSLCLGNCRTSGLFSLFQGKALQRARDRAESAALPFPECAQCNVWSLLPNNFAWHESAGRWVQINQDTRMPELDWEK